MDYSLIQHFGFAEMYEWKTPQNDRFGYLVELDTEIPNKIIKAKNPKNVIGVASISYATLSDNPTIWPKSYHRDPAGDTYMIQKTIARGVKQYDHLEEFAFISTSKDKIYAPKEYIKYDKDRQYVQRVDRSEWSPVTLLGKAIVYDYGTCTDLYCQLYNGDEEDKFGTVVPVYDESLPKYRILNRYAPKTLVILCK